METPTAIYASDRFTSIVEMLCRVLTKHGRARFVSTSLLLLIWNRLIRMTRQFARIAQRVSAGTLHEQAPARRPGAAPRPARARPFQEALPTHFRWLVNMIPEAEAIASDLCWLLQRAEMAELLFNAPQVGRILRPLCRMLGVEPIAELRRPMPPRLPQAPAPAQPVDEGDWPPLDAEFWKLHPPPKMD